MLLLIHIHVRLHSRMHIYRKNRSGGGISYSLRKDLNVFVQTMECLFIEFINDRPKEINIIEGVIYRPPNTSVSYFTDVLTKVLDKLRTEKKQVYWCGDYNINLLNIDKHDPSSELLESLFYYSLYPLINRPTRLTQNSAILIDNIFSNALKDHLFTGSLYTDISDHFPIFVINHDQSKEDSPKYIQARQYSQNNISLIQAKWMRMISQMSWAIITHSKHSRCSSKNIQAYTKPVSLLNLSN